MRNILLLTPLYPASDLPKEYTPVVHYFAREWVKMGYNVTVVHYIYNFPQLFLWGAKIANKLLKNHFGMAVIRTTRAHDMEYELEGVTVRRIPVMKFVPHGKYPGFVIKKAINKTIDYCKNKNFVPDVVISHWVNPQLEIMNALKSTFNIPSSLIIHLDGKELSSFKDDEINEGLSKIDCIGFRSDALKRRFLAKYSYEGPTFPCYSGIPESIMLKDVNKNFSSISRFAFVGTLIERKYPAAIISALVKSFGNNHDFKMTYVGRGNESKHIEDEVQRYSCAANVEMLGFVPREKAVEVLKSSDVFVMISTHETFGLVYLEAMAAGCITIASREEGFDGIIKHGENGFLCEAGNSDELADLIKEIRNMGPEELCRISRNAIATARTLTDSNAAKIYIDYVKQACKIS